MRFPLKKRKTFTLGDMATMALAAFAVGYFIGHL